MARPTLLTAELIAEAAKLLPGVMYCETLADLLGIARRTFFGCEHSP